MRLVMKTVDSRALGNRNGHQQRALGGSGPLALTMAATLVATMGTFGLIGCGGGGSSSGTGGKGTVGGSSGTGGGSSGTGGRAGSGSGGSIAGGADAGATGGAGTGTDAATTGADLGKACAAATDCGGGLICLLPTDKVIFGQGAPAHGYCTFACNENTDLAKCDAIGGACVDLSLDQAAPAEAYCLQSCSVGSGGVDAKCHTRPDVACTPLSGDPDAGVIPDVCLPTCSQDSDCPTNRKCDDRYAVCVDTKTAGDAAGAHCAYDANGTAAKTCAGLCLPIGDGNKLVASFCTRRCVYGSLNACNFVAKASSLTTGGAHGACILGDDKADIGDQGFCVEQCDTANQCSDKADPGVACDTSVMELGHGFCSWPAPTSNVDAGTGG